MTNVIELGLKDVQNLTFEEAAEFVRRNSALGKGVICVLGENGREEYINFGNPNRMETLWMSEKLKELALEPIEDA
jgi:hypothetical protein